MLVAMAENIKFFQDFQN